jgi:signal peptidase I
LSQAQSPGESAKPTTTRWLRQIVETTLIALVLIFALRLTMQSFHIAGQSMEPTLHDQEYILVNKAAYLLRPPTRGDIIVFKYPLDPQEDYIKRIIAVPGDIVSVVNNMATVNGVTIKEPYINKDNVATPYPPMQNRVVEQNEYFVMGDNRSNSSDSRQWGFVPRDNIIGKAIVIYWPLNQNNFGLLPDPGSVFAAVP